MRLRGPDPAAFGELDVDPGDDADQAVEVLGQDAALVGDERQRRAFLEPAQLVEPAGRERLLDELDPEPLELGQQLDRLVRDPAGIGVDPDRSVEHRADGLERGQVAADRRT